jgi:transcriptional regulator with XRE-family HTH domain
MAPSPDPQPALGRAIRQLRKGRGMTQEQLGHAAGINLSQVSQLERGIINPRWGTVARLARGLGVEIEDVAILARRLGSPE